MSRPKKPDAIKKLQGTDRSDRMNFDQPVYDIVIEHQAPEYLSGLEVKAWNEIVPKLIKANVYTEIDLNAILVMITSLAKFWEIENLIKGKLGVIVNGKVECNNETYKLLQMQQTLWNRSYKLMIDFGMTPVARQKLRLQPEDGKPQAMTAVIPPKPQLPEYHEQE